MKRKEKATQQDSSRKLYCTHVSKNHIRSRFPLWVVEEAEEDAETHRRNRSLPARIWTRSVLRMHLTRHHQRCTQWLHESLPLILSLLLMLGSNKLVGHTLCGPMVGGFIAQPRFWFGLEINTSKYISKVRFLCLFIAFLPCFVLCLLPCFSSSLTSFRLRSFLPSLSLCLTFRFYFCSFASFRFYSATVCLVFCFTCLNMHRRVSNLNDLKYHTEVYWRVSI